MERLATVDARSLDTALRIFELANRAYDLFIRQDPSQQRVLLDLVTSNCKLFEDHVEADYRKPFDILVELAKAGTETPSGSGDPEGVHPVWSGMPDSNRRPLAPKAGGRADDHGASVIVDGTGGHPGASRDMGALTRD